MPEDHGSRVLRRLLGRCGAAVQGTHARLGDATASVDKDRLVEVMRCLRDDTDLTCVDYLGQEPRFEMVYHLYSVSRNHRLRVKARVPEQPCEIDTLCPLWASANWMEREVWDLYGVRFTGHPDPRRILLYEEFQGHPLRKDYPKERRQPLVGPNN